jgi:hypothetical protein
MGISNSNLAMLTAAKRISGSFDNVATLGKQSFWPSKTFLKRVFSMTNPKVSSDDILERVGTDGSAFLRWLGAKAVDEFDASPYEGAKVVHDMNKPIGPEHKGKYNVLFEGGSLEHIFDIRQALQNISDMVAIDGLFLASTCANNLLGHGFYQFSPELFFRYFCPANGWDSTVVFLVEHQAEPPVFWQVTDPKALGARIEIQNNEQLYIQVISRKTRHVDAAATPQQSDYVTQWSPENNGARASAGTAMRKPQNVFRKGTRRLKYLFRKLCNKFNEMATSSDNRPVNCYQRLQGLEQKGLNRVPLEKYLNGDFYD